MERLLKAPGIVVLFIIVLPFIMEPFVPEAFPTVRKVIGSIGYVIMWSWMALIAEALKSKLPKSVVISDTLFLINIIVLIIVFGGSKAVLEPGQSVQVEGLYTLPVLCGLPSICSPC
jgi:hypothetical protein